MDEITGIKEVLSYDPETGDFTHKVSRGRAREGVPVRSKDSHGYIRVSFKGKRYLAHRLAFYFMDKEIPTGDVDHINGIRDDNRWSNLREASRSQNLWNQKSTRGSSKYKGVTRHQKGWVAQLRVRSTGKPGYLGAYTCEKEAALTYNYEAEKVFGNYARFNQVFEDVGEGILDGET